MRIDNIDFIVPHIENDSYDEAVVFGMISWLWTHSPLHRNASVGMLAVEVIPAMKHRQFMIASQDGKPIFYCAWAWFDADAERRYISHPDAMTEQDVQSGDRLWFLGWVAPFGHTQQISAIALEHFFPSNCIRFLRFKPGTKEGRVTSVHGNRITPAESRAFFKARPIIL